MRDAKDGKTEDEAEAEIAHDDGRLMALLAAGDMTPLATLYVRYGAMIRSAIRRYAPKISTAEAEELGQEVFLALARTAPRYRPGDRFRAWLFGIAVNKARGWRRSTWLRRRLLERYFADRSCAVVATIGAQDSAARDREELRRALDRLSGGQREVLLLHAVDGFTGEEIAKILGVRPKTVWTRLHRARKAMMLLLEKEGTAAAHGEEGR